ncbi:reverse transcriptase domain-containing protein [Tanacetum coccineum]|uniref:Reverse transcriptase domain-containing protein n=1 Tax=Tanacetum coccineum TaxID=301880 RepID=A0ABQ5BYU1_9ASTR
MPGPMDGTNVEVNLRGPTRLGKRALALRECLDQLGSFGGFSFKMPPKKTPMTDDVIKELIDQGVTDALADYKANRSSGNGNDSHNSGSGGGRTPHTARKSPSKGKLTITDDVIKELIDQGLTDALADYKANRSSGNRNDSHNSGSGGGRTSHTASVCTYKDFLNCQPLNFKGIAGIVGLTQWFEKMEFVFHINNYTVECQVKHDVVYGMPWRTLMKIMTDKYYPRSEIKKLEIELWNLKVKGIDVVSYSQRFQELALMCERMLPEESDQVEKYVGGLPNMIQGNVMFARPKTMQETIKPADDLMDQKVRTYAEKQAENKRRLDNNSSDNNAQQPPFKRQDVARAYVVGPSEKKEYAKTLPLCNKCKFHHNAPCTNLTFYESGNQGHYRSDCPELKNRNRGNQPENGEARGMVYALGGGETNQDLNNIKDDVDA